MLNQITPIILTYNEEDNIDRTLRSVAWANQVIVIDSFSTDTTLAICAEHSNVRIIQRQFNGFANQCNFALKQNIDTAWVLSMDADYVISKQLSAELISLKPENETAAYQIKFDYLIDGIKIRSSLYPPRVCLYRTHSAQYKQDGHAHKVQIKGETSYLKSTISHDDRKPFSRWLHSQTIYAKQEATKLKQSVWRDLSIQDKLRKVALAPLLIIPYTLFVRGLILDGRVGLKYTAQRFIAEHMLQTARLKKLFT